MLYSCLFYIKKHGISTIICIRINMGFHSFKQACFPKTSCTNYARILFSLGTGNECFYLALTPIQLCHICNINSYDKWFHNANIYNENSRLKSL